MFGFTDGSDVDDEGGRTAYLDSVGRLSKRSANYAALRGSLGYSYSPTNKTNGWIEVSSQYEQIGLTPFEPAGGPMSSAGFGASVGLKHQILDREHSGIGLAVQAAPYWQSSRRADGTDRDIAGSEFKLLGDVALVADRIFGAVNLSYTPERTRMQATLENTSSTEASAAVAGRIAENVFVGAELRNLAFYDGILCSQSLGWALYAGPTIFVSIGGKGYVGAAWSEQLASKAVGRLGPNLDPIDHERHQFRIKAGYYF